LLPLGYTSRDSLTLHDPCVTMTSTIISREFQQKALLWLIRVIFEYGNTGNVAEQLRN